MPDQYLDELNPAQREAVINVSGPALVIAGAGAGKTRVLTYRIAHLLNMGVPAQTILALTFTNKAAGEMKNRIINIAGYNTARYLWMGTFHSIFARILRNESDKLGYPSSYTIYDSSDSKSLIRIILRELSLDDKVYKPSGVAARISFAKNNLITAKMYASSSSLGASDRRNRMEMMPEIYNRYAARCYKAGAMDFDDLLMNTNILLRDFPDALNEYREKFRYILVDEYQDTNYAQYLIVNRLSELHRNICVVGDDAQSIYSFRGARIENILNFKNDYPDYKLYKLEQNYRSTQNIVKAANSIIHKNHGQIKKTIFSKKAEGEKIQVLRSETDAEEGFRIASDIFDKSLSMQLKWEDFAILYRTNAQSRIFEETFRKKNIPYKIYGGLSFYERKEIKDILAYFRILVNHKDEEAFRRTINYPKRGLGKTTVDRIFEAAARYDVPAWTIITDQENYQSLFTPATWTRLSVYFEMLNMLETKLEENDAYAQAKIVIAETGISKDLREGQTPEEISRWENLQELLNAIKEFTEAAETNGEPSNLIAYLETVALLTTQDTEGDEDKNKVTLMTAHSAKGLEFKHIYIAGLEENLFPSLMSLASDKEIEEERRLFYVALTRAEEQATLSYARNRYKWGNLESCKPSRFLSEIDEQFLDHPQAGGYNINPTRRLKGRLQEENLSYRSGVRQQLRRVNISQQTGGTFDESTDTSLIIEGVKVVHERFGKGIVTSIEGKAPNTTAVVKFENSGERKLLLRFAKLRVL